MLTLLLLGTGLVSSLKAADRTVRPQPTTYKGWNGYVLKNDLVQLHVIPEIGGRVIQYTLGDEDFFWVNEELAGKTSLETGLDPEGAWLNYGGDKLWPAPQGWDNDQQWPGPPDAVLDGQPYRPDIQLEPEGIQLTSRDDPRCGIRFSRRLQLDVDSTHVSVEATMINVSDRPRRWGIWSHTQFDASLLHSQDYNQLMRAWCPVNPNSTFDRGYRVIFGEQDNPSFAVDTKQGLMKVSYRYLVGKIGLDSHAGWVATVDGRNGNVFVQRFRFEPEKAYPDRSSVEFWHNGKGRIHAYNKWIDMPDDSQENPYVFESEILSPFALLQPGESYTWTYDWFSCCIGGDFPVVECSDVGVVSEPLTCQRKGRKIILQGRFGIFYPGRIVLQINSDTNRSLETKILRQSVTPLEPVVLNQEITLPQTLCCITLILQDSRGRKIGALAQSNL